MEKALDVFSDAMDALGEKNVKHRVLIVGEGPARGWLEERLPDAIYTGHLAGDDLARAVASADVMLNPSVTEAFGNVTLEAMASGLPVVAVNATGATNLVIHGQSGFLAEPGDYETIADELATYAADPKLRRKHGQAGIKVAQGRDWDQINSAVLRTYSRVIERKKRHARLTRR
jgi:phosphatidylinositol alpha 1,6-mannosyltransferase